VRRGREDRIEINIDVQARQALNAMQSVQREAQKTARATASLAEKTTKIVEVNSRYVGVAVTSLAGLAAAYVSIRMRAEETERGIRALAGAYEQVQVATNGAVSATEALSARQQLLDAGLQPTADQLAAVTRAAVDYSRATGVEMSEAINAVTRAITERHGPAIQQLGLHINGAMTAQQAMNAMTRDMGARMAAAGPPVRTLAEDLRMLQDSAVAIGTRVADALQRAFAPLHSLIDRIHGGGTAASIWRELVTLGEADRTIAQQQRSNAIAERRLQARERLARMGVRIDPAQLRSMSVEELERAAATANADTAREQIEVDRRARARAEAERAEAERLRREDEAKQARVEAREGKGVRTDQFREERRLKLDELRVQVFGLSEVTALMARSFTELQTKALQVANTLGITARTIEEENDLFRSIIDSIDERERARAEEQRRVVDQREDVFAKELERANRERESSIEGRLASSLGVQTSSLEAEARATQQYADTITSAYQRMTGAITQHVEAVVTGQETIGQALLGAVADVTLALAREALPRSLMELAAGLAALANPVTAATAPLHFAASGVYAAIAAGAGIVGAGASAASNAMARRPAVPGVVADARAASGSSSGGGSSSGAPVTIVISSITPPGPRELSDLVRARDQAGRYGLDAPRPREVRT
jgi:hypothetical protein